MSDYEEVSDIRNAIDMLGMMSMDAVKEKIIDMLVESVEENVYAKYEPKEYRRHWDNGGLGSRETKQGFTAQEGPLAYQAFVADMTRHNVWNPPLKGDPELYEVAPIVETGEGYAFKQIPPRPFAQPVEDEIDAHEDIIGEIVANYINDAL